MPLTYQQEEHLDVSEFRDILVRSTLGQRRPIDEPDRLEAMCTHANLIITARLDHQLVGIARSLTDFRYCAYLSDLAVDQDHQGRGIGKQLIIETKLRVPEATLLLLAAPAARLYYPKIGMKAFPDCFLVKNIEDLS